MRPRPSWRAPALMAVSGFASLGYQIVWTQQAGRWLGHEAAAVLAVVAAFFGGLAVGAWGLGGRIERSARPARWYAACEALIAAWSLVLALLMAPAGQALLALTGADPTPARQWTVAFGGMFVLLLPATAAMGATLPALARVTSGWQAGGHSVALLYASNTLGAVAGVLATAFSLMPVLGLLRTALLCAALNGVCAVVAWRLPESPPAAPRSGAAPPAGLLPLLALTGFLGVGYEVLVVRVVSQVAENTVYTFAQLLAVYLVGSALGAAALPWLQRREPDRAVLRSRLLQVLGLTCALGTASLWGAPNTQAAVAQALGPGMAAALAAEAAVAFAAFGPPTLVMGALFAHLAEDAAAAGVGVGRALGANTLGAALAPALLGVLVLPAQGPKVALLALALAYLLAAAPGAWRASLPGLAAVAALAWATPALRFVDVPAEGHLIDYREGALGTVSVVEDGQGVRRLFIDNRQQEGSNATRVADERQARLPLLLHAGPKRVLFLGLGTGVTASSAARDPALEVEAVELLPEVAASARHFGEIPSRLNVHIADAGRYLRLGGAAYDVIVADNFHPARRGSASLYTVEHFAAVRSRLAPGGLFCQWLPLHQMDLATLRTIVASFMAANPSGLALLATNSLQTPVLGLVAGRDGTGFDALRVRDRLRAAPADAALPMLGLRDEMAVLGSFVAGPAALRRFAAGIPPGTDDRPLVAWLAPRLTYAPDSLPRDRLMALLEHLSVEPREVLAQGDALGPRLSAYWQARNRFLALGRDIRPTPDPRRMLAQLEAPLLALLQTSPDFRPAREPLLNMAQALEPSDPRAAHELRRRLGVR